MNSNNIDLILTFRYFSISQAIKVPILNTNFHIFYSNSYFIYRYDIVYTQVWHSFYPRGMDFPKNCQKGWRKILLKWGMKHIGDDQVQPLQILHLKNVRLWRAWLSVLPVKILQLQNGQFYPLQIRQLEHFSHAAAMMHHDGAT